MTDDLLEHLPEEQPPQKHAEETMETLLNATLHKHGCVRYKIVFQKQKDPAPDVMWLMGSGGGKVHHSVRLHDTYESLRNVVKRWAEIYKEL